MNSVILSLPMSSVGIIGGADGPTAVFVSRGPGFLVLGFVLAAVLGYLLGAVNFAIIVSKLLYHDDVRTHGSGTAGMTNMIRTYGKLAGVLTALGDVAKGVVAALLGEVIFFTFVPYLAPVCGAHLAGVFAVIGHLFPVYFGFKGGKGVLCAAGAVIATQPIIVVALVSVFLIQFFFTRIVSLGSIIVAAAYPICTVALGLLFHYQTSTLIFTAAASAVMAGLVIWMHRSNISRLMNGTEYRFKK